MVDVVNILVYKVNYIEQEETMKHSLCGLLTASALLLATAGQATARDFTVTGWGGAVQDSKRELVFTPFGEQEGVTVLDDVYTGGWAPFKAMQDTGVIPWDVIQVETAELVRGCEEGIFAEIDWKKIGEQDDFLPAAITDCGVGTIVWSIVVSYNQDLVDSAPTSAEDFWNIEKWPGKRGMRQGPKVNLEFALMADGVDPKDVYKVLSTKEGRARAFAKLDEIKPHVQWWKSGAQAPEWLVSGDVTMSLAYNGRVAKAIEEGKNLSMIWDNTLYDLDAWVIPAGSPYVDLAHKFIKFASDAELQAEYSNVFAYGPTVNSANDLIKSERFQFLPAGDNIATGLHIGSDEARDFWADNLEELNQIWGTWIVAEQN